MTTLAHVAIALALSASLVGVVGAESKEPDAFTARHSLTVRGLAKDGAREPDPVPAPIPCDVECLIRSYDWDDEQAMRVARCESGLNPAAYNPSGASGVFQIMPRWHAWRLQPGESLFDPAVNVRIAWELWSEQGWRPWVCSPW